MLTSLSKWFAGQLDRSDWGFNIDAANLRIRAEQLRVRMTMYPALILSQGILLPLFVLLYWQHVSHQWLLLWLLVFYALHSIELGKWFLYRDRLNSIAECRQWHRFFTAFALAIGTMWGTAAFLFFPFSITEQSIMICVMLGLVAGAVTMNPIHPPSLYAYVAGIMAPLIIRTLLETGLSHSVLAVMLLVFMLVVLAAGRKLNQTFLLSLQQRFENLELLKLLSEQKKAIEDARNQLEVANAELKESESRIREITETVGEGIYMMDENGLLVFVNHETEVLLGRTASELIGKAGHPLFHACDQAGSAGNFMEDCKIYKASKRGMKFSSEDETFCRKDGTRFNVSIRATPYIRNGKHSGTVVAFHDITEQKRTQARLGETMLQLEQVNESLERRVEEQTRGNLEKERMLIHQSRNAAMGEMISNIAHQWRQPLSTLGLVVQNIQLDYRENELNEETLAKYVDTAQECVVRMSQTIDDFRDFFRPDKAKKRFNIHKAIKESLRLLDATLKNHGIQVTLPDDPGFESFGHENEFSQVILNLIANAKDALLEKTVPHGRIEIALNSAGQTGIVSIRDNAGGIPDALMEKIFDPYFTTKAGGTGIGLYMSKMIMEKHMDGSIVCQNAAEGAEFTVSVPLSPDGKSHSAQLQNQAAATALAASPK